VVEIRGSESIKSVIQKAVLSLTKSRTITGNGHTRQFQNNLAGEKIASRNGALPKGVLREGLCPLAEMLAQRNSSGSDFQNLMILEVAFFYRRQDRIQPPFQNWRSRGSSPSSRAGWTSGPSL
jgi:hypothetical protein